MMELNSKSYDQILRIIRNADPDDYGDELEFWDDVFDKVKELNLFDNSNDVIRAVEQVICSEKWPNGSDPAHIAKCCSKIPEYLAYTSPSHGYVRIPRAYAWAICEEIYEVFTNIDRQTRNWINRNYKLSPSSRDSDDEDFISFVEDIDGVIADRFYDGCPIPDDLAGCRDSFLLDLAVLHPTNKCVERVIQLLG